MKSFFWVTLAALLTVGCGQDSDSNQKRQPTGDVTCAETDCASEEIADQKAIGSNGNNGSSPKDKTQDKTDGDKKTAEKVAPVDEATAESVVDFLRSHSSLTDPELDVIQTALVQGASAQDVNKLLDALQNGDKDNGQSNVAGAGGLGGILGGLGGGAGGLGGILGGLGGGADGLGGILGGLGGGAGAGAGAGGLGGLLGGLGNLGGGAGGLGGILGGLGGLGGLAGFDPQALFQSVLGQFGGLAGAGGLGDLNNILGVLAGARDEDDADDDDDADEKPDETDDDENDDENDDDEGDDESDDDESDDEDESKEDEE